MGYDEAYQPDRSLKGKLRRRLVRLAHRRRLTRGPERPMVTFSFDDAPASAVETGARLLEARGLRGVYYVSAGLAGRSAPMGVCADGPAYRALSKAGHELACHTFSHLDCGRASGAEALADVERNHAAFQAWGAPEPRAFAYPYGDVAAGPKAALGGRFSMLRALHHGLIVQGADLAQAPAVGIEGPTGEAVARRWLERARQASAWLVLYTHDVREQPSPWGCTPDALARLADAAVEQGFEVVTISGGMARLGA